MNRKTLILNLILFELLLLFTFYNSIPIPVEDMVGVELPEVYILGGFYYTSILQEFQFNNFVGGFSMLGLFGLCFFVNNKGKKWLELN